VGKPIACIDAFGEAGPQDRTKPWPNPFEALPVTTVEGFFIYG
jgi:hypothetical protein